MDLSQAVELIKNGVAKSTEPQIWADLGSGQGIFSAALSTFLAPSSKIIAVDIDAGSLRKIKLQSNHVELQTVQSDFTSSSLQLNSLDGIILANSLHFINDKKSFLTKLKSMVKINACVIIIEYDMQSANQWVPYPITFIEIKSLLNELGFTMIQKIGERKSVYNASTTYSMAARF